MNATFRKFGWPATRIADLEHWAVMLRPEQPTLGSVVLACKQPAQAFGDVDAAGYAELGAAVRATETMLRAVVDYRKINYLMLMMVDPDVHFHVLPRYEGLRTHAGIDVADAGWPGPPALGAARALSAAEIGELAGHLSRHWPQ